MAGKIGSRNKGPWFKKRSHLVMGVATAGGLLLLLLLIWGWFGGGSNANPPVVAARPTAQPPALPPAPPALPKPPAQPPQPNLKKKDPKKEEPQKKPKPPLSDDVTKWKKEDYFRARKENDPKLLQAVVYLGEKFPGSRPAAQGLTDLLKPLPLVKSQPGKPTKLLEAIVEALGSNGSQVAQNTLEHVLDGTFATDDDKAAVEAAIKTLAAHPCAENDALLLRVLTDAETLRPADRQGPWPAKELQAKAFELIKPTASGGLRTKLAEALISRRAGLDPKDPIRAFLLASDPLNCGAQLVFYRQAPADEIKSAEIKSALEQQFLAYSSTALARLLGIAENAETDQASRLAGQLWSDEFQALLEPQLESKADKSPLSGKQSRLMLLAGTIPRQSTRAVLAKALRRHWNEGPKSLETAGLTDRVITDPGLLVLIKTLPRKEAKSTARSSVGGGPSRPRPTRSGPLTALVGGGKIIEAAQKKQQAKQDWMNVSSKLVAAWCKRFRAAAALAKEQKAPANSNKPAGDAAAPRLPEGFELGRDAKVTAAHHVAWPDEAPPELAKLKPDPLEVYYVRAEETKKLKSAIAFYGRQARTSRSRTIDKSVWIDSLRPGSRQDRWRSVDVLITPVNSGTAAVAEKEHRVNNNKEEVALIVEVLIVEIKDPAKG